MDAVTWSLTSELFFYCLVPLIILKLPRISQRLLLFGVLTLISLASRVYTTFDFFGVLQDQLGGFTWQYVYFLPPTHLWLFLAGVLLWTLTKQMSGHRLRLLLASALLAGSVAALLAFLVLDVNLPWMRKSPTMMILELTVIGFFAAALLDAPLLRGLLSWKPLIFIGTISYSLFLLHGTVALVLYGRLFEVLRGWVTNGGLPGTWAAFFICTSVTLVAACVLSYLSYRYNREPLYQTKAKVDTGKGL